jgi:dGTPase
MSEPVLGALDELRQFMFDNVYLRSQAAEEQEKAIGVIRALIQYHLDHPEEVPEEYARAPGELADRVADYIAGMTDRFALRTYERLFLPRGGML